MVTHDPGDWFEETLRSLADQDCPDTRVVVVDAASPIDLSQSISTILPEAIVHRLPNNPGFGAAANEVLELIREGVVEAPDYFLFCHDDVAPRPDALARMVDTAEECGAAVVGPKLVMWDDASRFAQMGAVVDKSGVTMPLVEPGELDQGQHDGRREVFEVPGAFTLVRSDLFVHIGGFDEAITYLADDLSLCWRARLAGALVVVASDARVRHVEALRQRLGVTYRRRLLARHRLRVVMTSYQRRQLASLLPQLAVSSAAETAISLVAVKIGRARAAAGAWWWNLTRCRSTWRARKHVKRLRRVDDDEIRRLQVPGLIRPRMLLQRVGSGARQVSIRDRMDVWGGRITPGSVMVGLLTVGLFVLGSRHLLSRGVPAVGDFARFSPTSLRTLLTVGLVPVGLVGMAWLMRPTRSSRAAVGAAIAYLVVPVPYDALADGRWAPLASYAAAPWLLAVLARASHIRPFGGTDRSFLADVTVIGVVTALLGVFVPLAAVVTMLLAVGLALGGVVAFERRGTLRLLTAGLLGGLIGVALDVPRTLELVHGPASKLPWPLLVAAVGVLFVGRSWRLSWALRGWAVGMGGWALASQAREADVLMACAGAGFALAVGMGIVAIEVDVAGRARRFGFRRMVVATGSVALFAAVVPVVFASMDGYWRMPRGDFGAVLGFLNDAGPGTRVVWVGDPGALPSASWRLDDATGITVTDGLPTIHDVWRGPPAGPVQPIAHAVEQATDQDTTRLGQLLAPHDAQYVVVPERLAPVPVDSVARPAEERLVDALAGQLDLERVDVDPGVTVYRNTALDPAPTGGPTVTGLASLTPQRRLLLGLQALLWIGVVSFLVVQRRRRQGHVPEPEDEAAPPPPPVDLPVEDEGTLVTVKSRRHRAPATVTRHPTIKKRTVRVKRKPLPTVVESVTIIRPTRSTKEPVAP
jgi:GT2 family glycosyltransferase